MLLSVLICVAGHVYIYRCVVYFCLCVYWEHMLSLVRLKVGDGALGLAFVGLQNSATPTKPQDNSA